MAEQKLNIDEPWNVLTKHNYRVLAGAVGCVNANAIILSAPDALYIFDINENAIKLFLKHPNDYKPLNNGIAISKDENEVYLYCGSRMHAINSPTKLASYNIKENKWAILANDDYKNNEYNLRFTGSYPYCLIDDNNNLHCFTGPANKNHTYLPLQNKDKIKFIKAFSFPTAMSGHRVVYNSHNKTFSLFGGFHWGKFSDSVWCSTEFKENDLYSFTWTERDKTSFKLPVGLAHFGIINYENKQQQKVLIFGGQLGKEKYSNKIYITDNNQWWESKIDIPFAGEYHAVLINDSIHLIGWYNNCNHYQIDIKVLLNENNLKNVLFEKHKQQMQGDAAKKLKEMNKELDEKKSEQEQMRNLYIKNMNSLEDENKELKQKISEMEKMPKQNGSNQREMDQLKNDNNMLLNENKALKQINKDNEQTIEHLNKMIELTKEGQIWKQRASFGKGTVMTLLLIYICSTIYKKYKR